MVDFTVKPAKYTPEIAHAVKAFFEGRATPGQQKMLAEWHIHQVCLTYDQSFIPGEPDATAFKEGMRFVGNTWLKMLRLTPKQLEEDNDRTQS